MGCETVPHFPIENLESAGIVKGLREREKKKGVRVRWGVVYLELVGFWGGKWVSWVGGGKERVSQARCWKKS